MMINKTVARPDPQAKQTNQQQNTYYYYYCSSDTTTTTSLVYMCKILFFNY